MCLKFVTHNTEPEDMTRRLVKIAVLVACLLVPVTASADPFQLSYSGRLTNDAGKPMAGEVDLQLKLFRDNADPGTIIPVTVPVFQDVLLSQGMFQVLIALDPDDFHTAFDGSDVWVEVKDLTSNKTYPRQRFLAVPYALKVPVDDVTLNYDASGKLQLKTANAPANNKVLKWIGAGPSWEDDISAGAGSITNTDLQSDAVTTDKIDDGTITGTDIAAGTITDDKLATIATAGKVSDTALSAQVTKLGSAIDLNSAEVSGTLPVGNLPLGTTAAHVVVGNDARLSDSRAPNGAAGGDLSGTYPSPQIGTGVIVNSDINAGAAIDTSKLSGAVTSIASHGLGTMATQNANAVAITGGTIAGVTQSGFTSTGIDDNASSTAVTISASNHVGIGTTGPGARLHVAQSAYANSMLGFFNYTTATGANAANPNTGIWANAHDAVGGGFTNSSYTQGLYGSGRLTGAGTLSGAYGVSGIAGTSTGGTGTVTDAYALWGRVWNNGGGTITRGYGLYLGDTEATSDWGVYQNGADDDNYFAGNVGIGDDTPSTRLDVAGEVKLGSTAVACSATTVGAMRYDAASARIQNCVAIDGGSYAWRSAVGHISSNLTLTVADPSLSGGDDCALIQQKIDLLQGYTIDRAATVTISLPDGTYNCSSPVVVALPIGGRILIVGDVATPANVELIATDAGAVAVYPPGLGLLNGMTITGAGTASGNLGVQVSDATLEIGNKVVIRDYNDTNDHCVHIDRGSTVTVQSPTVSDYLTVNNCWNGISVYGGSLFVGPYTRVTGSTTATGHGILANQSSVVVADFAQVSGTYYCYLAADSSTMQLLSSQGSVGFFVYHATRASSILASSASASNYSTNGFGFYATMASSITCPGCTANGAANSGDTGFSAATNSFVDASTSTSQNHTYGFSANTGGQVYAGGVTVSGNTTDYVPAINTTGSRGEMVGN
jgi:hypothetical protein